MDAFDGAITAVIGQGYVGLPLAHAVCEAGGTVFGLDVSTHRVDALNRGISPVDDLTDKDLENMLARGYRASASPNVLSGADFVVICVPTPLDDSGGPDLGAVEVATRTIADYLKPGACVILESTTYPGTTEDIVLPILEANGQRHGRDFFLAYSPERVDPGSAQYGIKNTPKLVGGLTTDATRKAVSFYNRFVDEVVPVSGAKEAETAKLLENTYRHVNIALVNEMARFCHDLGIDIWEVIRAASTKPFGFQKFTPGPGVGGHCIPIDPNYLSFQVKKALGYQFRFVELAQEINNSMPQYIGSRVSDLLNEHSKPLKNANVLLLGVTYKPDIADQRESPAFFVAKVLREKKASVTFHDPLVEKWGLPNASLERVQNLEVAVQEADAVVLLQHHDAYDIQRLASKAQIFFDTRGVAPPGPNVHSL